MWCVTHASFDDVVINTTDDVLLEVYAPDCSACAALAPRLRMVAMLLKSHGIHTVRVATMVSSRAVHDVGQCVNVNLLHLRAYNRGNYATIRIFSKAVCVYALNGLTLPRACHSG